MEKPSPVEKKYEPVPQVTPSLPPATLPKPAPEGEIYSFYYVVWILSDTRFYSQEDASVLCFTLKTLSPEKHCLLYMPKCPEFTQLNTCMHIKNIQQSSFMTFLALLQSSLPLERTLSRPTSFLTRVSLRNLQLTAQANSLQKQSQAPELHQYPTTTAMRPSPTPHLPSLLHACSTVLNSTTTFCQTTSQKLLQR